MIMLSQIYIKKYINKKYMNNIMYKCAIHGYLMSNNKNYQENQNTLHAWIKMLKCLIFGGFLF